MGTIGYCKRFFRPWLLAAALGVLSLPSCVRRTDQGYAAVRYVGRLMADSLSYVQRLGAQSGKASGTVFILGDPEQCLRTVGDLLSADNFDNIDGAARPDGLKDFAGERFCVVFDCANAPYEGYLPARDTQFLRESAVRMAVAALDTLCRPDRYNPAASAFQAPAKVLIVCSTLLDRHAVPDIRDFLERAGAQVPVLSSPDTAAVYAADLFRLMRERRLFTHTVAQPAADLYMTYPVRDLQFASRTDSIGAFLPSYKYSRPAGDLASTFSVIRLREDVPAFKLQDVYVQNKY